MGWDAMVPGMRNRRKQGWVGTKEANSSLCTVKEGTFRLLNPLFPASSFYTSTPLLHATSQTPPSQREVLEETTIMIPDCKKRLAAAHRELAEMVEVALVCYQA